MHIHKVLNINDLGAAAGQRVVTRCYSGLSPFFSTIEILQHATVGRTQCSVPYSALGPVFALVGFLQVLFVFLADR
jgi:hypothetical protein